MQAVAGGVAHGVDPSVEVGEGGGVVVEFVEDGVDCFWVGLGADSGVVLANSGGMPS